MNLIDLSNLPAPTVIEELSFEKILEEIVTDYKARFPNFSAYIENEPIMKQLETLAYRELLLRQRINEACRAVMIVYAKGADLEHQVIRLGVRRLTITPEDTSTVPPTPAVMESDASLLRRYFLAIHAQNTAGSTNSYVYHTFTCPAVRDATAISYTPGEVIVTVAAHTEDGTPTDETIAEVVSILDPEDVRPLTDTVKVQKASVVNYAIDAEIVTLPGPDATVIIEAARAAATKYVADVSLIGREVAISGIYAALHQPGVAEVNLISPNKTIKIADDEVSHCTSINLTHSILS